MSHPTNPADADATVAVGTMHLDVTGLARQTALLVVRGLVARSAHEDLAGLPAVDRISARGCPSCGEIMWIEPEAPLDTLCATCQNHGDLRRTERA